MKDGCETEATRTPWNKGKLVGPKLPLQPKHVWAIKNASTAVREGAKPRPFQHRDR